MPGWKRILQHRFYCTTVNEPAFKGIVTLYCMDRVNAPLMVEYFGRKTVIADTGYSWLKHFSAGEQHFTVTTQFDAQQQIIAWYIDICLRTGIDQNHIPWMDDLFLDIVVSPAMEIEVKDADELLAARESGLISREEFAMAWVETNKLLERITKQQFRFFALSSAHREKLLGQNDVG